MTEVDKILGLSSGVSQSVYVPYTATNYKNTQTQSYQPQTQNFGGDILAQTAQSLESYNPGQISTQAYPATNYGKTETTQNIEEAYSTTNFVNNQNFQTTEDFAQVIPMANNAISNTIPTNEVYPMTNVETTTNLFQTTEDFSLNNYDTTNAITSTEDYPVTDYNTTDAIPTTQNVPEIDYDITNTIPTTQNVPEQILFQLLKMYL